MRRIALFAAVALGGLLLLVLIDAASAQQAMGNQPWNFTAQNRAGIAALIEQQADGEGNSGVASANACGGGGTTTATSNYTCIILNNSNATIGSDQDSLGDQTATSDTETSVSSPGDDFSEVLETLGN